MSKKLDSILSRVPPAVTTETNMTYNFENQEKQERIVAEIPSTLKKEIKRYLVEHPKETERTVVLKGLEAIGFNIQDIKIKDRRGRD
jgi:hypothetical protein